MPQTIPQTIHAEAVTTNPLHFPLTDLIDEFGEDLLESLNRSHPPIYVDGQPNMARKAILDNLKRQPFPAQAEVVQAVTKLLIEQNEHAAIINGEMGCGKTLLAIAVAAVLYQEGFRRSLILSPPHLVYKWRREIKDTVSNAQVWILNGPDTLSKLIKLKEELNIPATGPEFFILGRVRMRMGFHWRPAFNLRYQHKLLGKHPCCPGCGAFILDENRNPFSATFLQHEQFRRKCTQCDKPLWTLMRPCKQSASEQSDTVFKSLCRVPTIGPVTAKKLINKFGNEFIASMLGDNLFNFINLLDDQGKMYFSDRQAVRMERAFANLEFSFGEGGYQPTEYIKRFLPDNTFDLLIIDEGHEYKGSDSAQGQAMGVLASKARKVLMLTGTLMGGYADDLFYLLFRILTNKMIEDGYRPNQRGSLTSAAMAFMRDHGVLKEIRSIKTGESYKTAKGQKTSVKTIKAPGFGPKGLLRCLLPFTVFLKLADLGKEVLPPYQEEFREVTMIPEQQLAYDKFSGDLVAALKQALAKRDTTLLGVVLNALLAWPECCFKAQAAKHPHTKDLISFSPVMFSDDEATPKEKELIEICQSEIAAGRKVLVYSTYTGTRDTTARLKVLLERAQLKAAVLRSTVSPERREDWIADQVDKGIEVVVSNPELVKTGLDLLEFPTIVFMQTGFNVYTLLQAARRSWRIGQTNAVNVIFLGYAGTAQMTCLALMSQKIAVAQSTAGDIPESGLDILNPEGDSMEISLARQLAT